MTHRVHINPAAIADSQAIHAYLFEASPDAADRVLELLEKAADALCDFPRRYPVAPESARHNLEIRQLRVGNYVMLFMIIEDVVNVLRIRHAAQRPFKPGELN